MKCIKVKAGALNYAIMLSIIVALMAMALLALNRFQLQTEAQFSKNLNLNNKVSSLMSSLRASSTGTNIVNKQEELFLSNGSTRWWGAYKFIQASVSDASNTAHKAGLFGQKHQPFALYLADRNRGLKLAGETKIQGQTFLPAKGVQAAYIEGKSYSRNQLVYGPKQKSKKQVEELHPDLIAECRLLLKAEWQNNDSLTWGFEGTYHQPWNKPTAVWDESGIYLEDDSLSGKILIYSPDSIVVGRDAYLDQVWLVAPKIIIDEGFNGRIHVLASDTILVGQKVKLSYPSSLIILDEDFKKSPLLKIDSLSSIEGSVVHILTKYRRSYKANILLEKTANITGQVYTQGNLELRGQVNGSVWANRIVLHTRSSVYENHLLDAHIYQDSLPQPFAGICFKNINANFPVLWL